MSYRVEVYLAGTATVFATHSYTEYELSDSALLLDLDDSDTRYASVVYPLNQFYFKSLRED